LPTAGPALHIAHRRTPAEASLQLDIIVPVVMSCALLWWVSRGMSWTTRLAVTAVTLGVVLCVVLFERSGQ
jgi:membrane protein CcdC involved in cytochrome C biogenesis